MYPRLLRWLGENKITIEQGRIFHEQVPIDAPLRFDA
jgi:hypothetical protein